MAPDCCTVVVVPSRSGADLLVHATPHPQIMAAQPIRSLVMRRLVVVALVAVLPARSPAQGFPLTVANLMRGPDLYGTAPSNVRFSVDGRYVYFRWRRPGLDTLDEDYRAGVAGGAPERLPQIGRASRRERARSARSRA